MQLCNKRLVVVGDRVLLKPEKAEERTRVGLYLPQTVVEKERVSSGRIVSTGPGIAVPGPPDIDHEPWRERMETAHYIPMQVEAGDFALYLRKEGIELRYEDEEYIIVPQSAILAVVREEDEIHEDEVL